MIARLLSFLFPPQLPSRMTGWEPHTDREIQEQGGVGKVQFKKYRNGIERHFAEAAK